MSNQSKVSVNELFVSSSIAAQPAGLPEILKKSLHSCSVQGGEEVFIIGKNFLKDTKVIFQENISGKTSLWTNSVLIYIYIYIIVFCESTKHILFSDDSSWKAEAEIDMELFHQVKCDLIRSSKSSSCSQLSGKIESDLCEPCNHVIHLNGCWFKGLSGPIVYWPNYTRSPSVYCTFSLSSFL